MNVAYLLPALVILSLFIIWPLLWVVGMSFTSWDGLGPIHWVGLDTWQTLIADQTFWAALRNTLIWVALSATLPVFLGFLLALIFHASHRPIRTLGISLAVLPLLIPLAATAVSWRLIYNPNIGPINRFLALLHFPQPDWIGDPNLALWSLYVVMLWASVGFSVIIFTGALRSIDRTWFDLARSEGAGAFARIRHVVLPACRRTAALAVIVTVVISAGIFDLVYVVTTAANDTIMLPLDMYDRAFKELNVSSGAAEATIQMAIAAVLAAAIFWMAGSQEGMHGESGSVDEPRPRSMISVIAVAACFVLALPLLADLSLSLAGSVASAINPPTFPWPPDFSSFATGWGSGGIGLGVWDSFVTGAVVVVLTLALAFPAAFALADSRLPAVVRSALIGVLLFALLLPGEPYLVPVYYLVQALGIGDMTGVILTESARELPFAIILFWVYIAGLSKDIVGAAEIEGGRGLRTMTKIVLPMVLPVAAVVCLWVMVTSWSETTLPNILLNNSSIQTAPMALQNFASTVDTQNNLLAAGSLLLVMPALAFLLIAFGPAARGVRLAGRALNQ